MVDGAVPSRGHGGHRPNGVPLPAPTQWTVRAGRRPLRTVDSGHCPLCVLWCGNCLRVCGREKRQSERGILILMYMADYGIMLVRT